jgi:transcriptional regulator with XRE-family HTH domain
LVEAIRSLCKERGITLAHLEKTLGFGNGTISRWDENRPSVDKAKAVSSFLDVTIDDLLNSVEAS